MELFPSYFPTIFDQHWITSSRGRPGLLDCRTKLLVRLVHLLHAPHEDLQVDPDEGEEGGLEVDLPLLVHRHVHPHQALVGQQVGALTPEPQGRIDLAEQGQQVRVVDQPSEKAEDCQVALGTTYSVNK